MGLDCFRQKQIKRERGGAARIRCVAARCADGTILSKGKPARHADLILMAESLGKSWADATQGFLTTHGEFVDRAMAYSIARRAGQIGPVMSSAKGQLLYSEDLW